MKLYWTTDNCWSRMKPRRRYLLKTSVHFSKLNCFDNERKRIQLFICVSKNRFFIIIFYRKVKKKSLKTYCILSNKHKLYFLKSIQAQLLISALCIVITLEVLKNKTLAFINVRYWGKAHLLEISLKKYLNRMFCQNWYRRTWKYRNHHDRNTMVCKMISHFDFKSKFDINFWYECKIIGWTKEIHSIL